VGARLYPPSIRPATGLVVGVTLWILYRDTVENWARAGALVELTEPIDDYRLAADLARGDERERVQFGPYTIVVLETPYPSWSYYRLLVYRDIAARPVAAVDLWRGVGAGIAVPGYRVQIGRSVTVDPPFAIKWQVTYEQFVAGARKRLDRILLAR